MNGDPFPPAFGPGKTPTAAPMVDVITGKGVLVGGF
jgi:hypothetical protein